MNVSGAGLSKKSKIFRIGCVDIFLEPLKVGGKSGKSVNPGWWKEKINENHFKMSKTTIFFARIYSPSSWGLRYNPLNIKDFNNFVMR